MGGFFGYLALNLQLVIDDIFISFLQEHKTTTEIGI
jgi:hypothetical protein